MTYETIKIETDARGVATLTLNQPDRHNAMSPAMLGELSDAAQKLGEDDTVRVVVLTGAGKSFCAGGDLSWMRSQFDGTRETRIAEAMKLATLLKSLNELPKPMIGRINGQAFGGGIGMMCVCDVAIGVDTAKFALTETRLGLIPATISPYVLARIGERAGRRLFMSGKGLDGPGAVAHGLLSECVTAEELDAAVEAEIEPYLSTAPGAVARAKALLRSIGPRIDDEILKDTAGRLADCWESAETVEGVEAFLSRQKPSWQR